jgi:hypothetical protein
MVLPTGKPINKALYICIKLTFMLIFSSRFLVMYMEAKLDVGLFL